MSVRAVIAELEKLAPPSLQEKYDNAGLLTGHPDWTCTGIVCSLDATEEVVLEAVARGCNMVVAHHPIIFSGLKKINGSNYVERAVIAAIRNDIAIYAIHTNLDNILGGVSGRMAMLLGLQHIVPLLQKEETLRKLFTFVPAAHAARVRDALFEAGGGSIGRYSECSFNSEGTGTFKAGMGADPFVGQIGQRHEEAEIRIELVFPYFLQGALISALRNSHPYEEVAYDIVALRNAGEAWGAGAVGELASPVEESEFLEKVRSVFGLQMIRHTPLRGKKISRVALCGGAGSFLTPNALSQNADIYLTADIKYHEFFDGNGKMLIADIGHYESEQFTIDLLLEILAKKFLTFAILKTEVNTNPVRYLR
jgi:dinuclear metal center YbgI/SA1388 family protein